MRRLALVLSVVASLPIRLSAQAPAQSAPAQPLVTKDQQAVSILNQVVALAGGSQAITAIKDYTASGSVTFYGNEASTVDVTIKGKGLNQLRLDESFPTGMHSLVLSRGTTSQKIAQGQTQKLTNTQAAVNTGVRLLPEWQIAVGLQSKQVSISYKGTTQLDGRSVFDIALVQTTPGIPDSDGRVAAYHTTEFWIDSSNYQVVMMQNVGPKRLMYQVVYSDFRAINGVLVPFSVTEEITGLRTSVIQLSSISFNSGLQDADFAL